MRKKLLLLLICTLTLAPACSPCSEDLSVIQASDAGQTRGTGAVVKLEKLYVRDGQVCPLTDNGSTLLVPIEKMEVMSQEPIASAETASL